MPCFESKNRSVSLNCVNVSRKIFRQGSLSYFAQNPFGIAVELVHVVEVGVGSNPVCNVLKVGVGSDPVCNVLVTEVKL